MRYKEFKGSANQYRGLHDWVRQQLGTPQYCENCGTTEAARFEWANISYEYKKDLSDWVRLCSRCHKYIDGHYFKGGEKHPQWSGEYCLKGHLRSEENTLIKTQWKVIDGKKRYYSARMCRPCQQMYYKAYQERQKELLNV